MFVGKLGGNVVFVEDVLDVVVESVGDEENG